MSATRRTPTPEPETGAPSESPLARDADLWMPEVYDELRRLAARYLAREAPGPTLQATGLVHEAYLRLARQGRARWHDRAHFFRIAARMMRRVLVDRYRSRRAHKRGSGLLRITLAPDAAAAEAPEPLDLLALDAALQRLAALDEQQAAVVELRYFAGLTVTETAAALGVSTPTVKRDWALARAWLLMELGAAAGSRGR